MPVYFIFFSTKAQSYSNKGTDFWTGYGMHASMFNPDGTVTSTGGEQEMVLYFTANRGANIKVEIPSTGWSRNYTIKAGGGSAVSDPIPKTGTDDSRIVGEGISNKGIHITSDIPVAAFCHIYEKTGSATTLLVPTDILGQDYYSLNFTQASKENYAYSFAFVVATEDSTTVEITPSVNTILHPKNVAFTQMLQKGEIYNIMGALTGQSGGVYNGEDLTGTRIRTIVPGKSACKKIAVFCGSGKTIISCTPGAYTSDNLFQQMYPSDAWGNRFFSAPTVGMPNNIFRVLVKSPTTVVRVNGNPLSGLINGRYYEFQSKKPCNIISDQDILIAKYITSGGQCGNTLSTGDPDMIYLLPVSQSISSAKVISPSSSGITSHYINIVISTYDTAFFQLDGVFKGGSFQPFSPGSKFSHAEFKVSPGVHEILSDSGFNAIAYGYGPEESYGYSVGFNLRHLLNFLSIQNPYGPANSIPQTCRNTPFKLAVNLVFKPRDMVWDLSGNPGLSPNDSVIINNAVPDSVIKFDGERYYRYTLPGVYTFSDTGKLEIKLNTYFPTQDGCTAHYQIVYDIDVREHPIADWKLNYDKCSNDTLFFKDTSITFTNKAVAWLWNFGDGTTDSVDKPVKKYANYGDYDVALRTITDIGCYADTIKPISLSPYPVADFTAQPNCEKSPVIFTDLSTISWGSITSWFWDFGDKQTSDVQNPPTKIYAVGGPYQVKLTVSNKNGCISDTTKNLIIYPYPTITIYADTFVYQGNSLQLKPLYTGNNLQYKWSPPTYLSSDAVPFPITTPNEDITYHLTVTGDGQCVTEKDIFIDVIQVLTIPNAFSPNGDGINDKWRITNLDFYPTAEVSVFNRYGQSVFYSTNYASNPWDGNFKGKPVPVGTYYYIVNPKNKYLVQKTGYIVVLR